MFIGVQLSAPVLGGMLSEGLKRLDLCVTDQFNGYVVDHIVIDPVAKFGEGSAFVAEVPVSGHGDLSIPAHAVAYSQDVTVHIVQTSDLAPNDAAPTTTLGVPLTITFDLRFDVSGTSTAFTLTYQSVTSLFATADQLKQLDAILKGHLPPQTEALDLVALTAGLGVVGLPAQAGAGVSSDGSFVEFRLELTSVAASDNFGAWEGFFTSGPDTDFTAADSLDWDLWVTVDGLEQSLSALFKNGLKGSTSFKLESEIDVAWQPSTPALVVTFNGDVINACTCFWSTIDVNVDVTVTISFSIDSGMIRYDIHTDHSSNQWELFCCELTSALFWPVIGAIMMGSGQIDVGDYVLGWLGGPIGVFIAGIVAASTQSTPIPSSALSPTCTKDDDSDFHCLVALPPDGPPPSSCDPPSIDTRVPTAVFGKPAGVVLPGILAIGGSESVRQASQPTLKCEVNDFTWLFPAPTCSGVEGSFTMSASIVLTGTGDIPIRFCAATVLGDNLSAYQPYLTMEYSYCPMVVTVHMDVPVGLPDAGPCEVLIQTTGGARVVTLHPIPQPTPQELQQWKQDVEKWRLAHCYTLLDPWYRLFHQLNPKWLVDPPSDVIDPERVSHVWEVVVAGAVSGDVIVARGPSGEQLGQARVDGAGVARLDVVTVPVLGAGGGQIEADVIGGPGGAIGAGTGPELALQRLRAGAATGVGHQVSIRMMMKQILLVEQAQLLVGRSPQAVLLISRDGHRALMVTHEGAVSTYDLSNAAAPRLVEQNLLGLTGSARSRGNALLGWDQSGVVHITTGGAKRVIDIEDVSEVQAYGSGHLVLRSEDLLVVDASWRVVEQVGLDESHPAVQQLVTDVASVAGPFGPSAHSRFGLVARVDTDRVSIGLVAATRLV